MHNGNRHILQEYKKEVLWIECNDRRVWISDKIAVEWWRHKLKVQQGHNKWCRNQAKNTDNELWFRNFKWE